MSEPTPPEGTESVPPQTDPPSSQNVEPSVSSLDRRISLEDAQKAETRNRQQWIEVMDNLEASTETQGRYFVKFGLRSEDPDEDSRALVLIEPHLESRPSTKRFFRSVENKPDRVYVVITRDGPKRIVFHEEHFGEEGTESYQNDFAQDLIWTSEHPEKSLSYEPYEPRSRLGYSTEHSTVNVAFYSGPEIRGGSPMYFITSFDLGDIADQGIVQDVIKKSIERCESPNKARVEKANQNSALAAELKNMIGSLPPRA